MCLSDTISIDNEYRYHGFSFFVYRPRLTRLFLVNYQEMYLKKTVRFILSMIRGSVIIYMKKDDEIVGYCLLEPGEGRYPDISGNDVVISPYVIKEDQRGKGYGTVLLSAVKDIIHNEKKIYAMVKKDNIPSVRAMEKAGYSKIAFADIHGFLRRYSFNSSDESKFYVYVS